MSEWRKYKLSDLITIKHGFAFKGEFITDEETPNLLLTPGNFAIGGGFQFKKMKFYSGEIPKDYILSEGDLIVTMTDLSKEADTLGYSAVVPGSDHVMLHNQRLGKVALKSSDTTLDFVHWLMRTSEYRHEILSNYSGSTVKHTSPSKILAFEFRLPPLSEQREIASILGSLDDKIELNRKMATTLEAMARALYRSWFVDFDPVHARSQGLPPAHMDEATAALFPDRFGEDGLPEGWKIAPLSAMCDHVKKTVKPMESPDNAFLHFSLPAFDAGKMPAVEPGAAIKSNKTFVPHNAILFSRLNPTIPRVWWARTKVLDATPASSTEFFIAKAHDPSETAWLYCALSSEDFREAACSRVTGTSNSHQRIPPKALAEIEVIAPSLDVVSAFGELTGPWFEKIHTMATENQILAALRDTLLPKLMSGELRVGEARDQIEEVA